MGKWQFWVLPAVIVAVAIIAFVRHDDIVKTFAKSTVAPLASPFAKSIYSLPDCDSPPDANTVGTVNIILPDKFDGNKIDRHVNSGPKEPKGDPNTGENQSGFHANGVGQTQPFDFYAPWSKTAPPSPSFMLARVLLTKGNKFSFYQNGLFFGVGRNDDNDGTLCGAAPAEYSQNPGQGQAEEIATFYIDLAKLHDKGATGSAHFTIGLVGTSGAGSTTPILIDPKVENDGGGTRSTGGG